MTTDGIKNLSRGGARDLLHGAGNFAGGLKQFRDQLAGAFGRDEEVTQLADQALQAMLAIEDRAAAQMWACDDAMPGVPADPSESKVVGTIQPDSVKTVLRG